MEISEFIKSFAYVLEGVEEQILKPNTRLRDLEQWDSLAIISFIAMVDSEYSKTLKGSDIREALTIQDLYNLIQVSKC